MCYFTFSYIYHNNKLFSEKRIDLKNTVEKTFRPLRLGLLPLYHFAMYKLNILTLGQIYKNKK